MGRAVFCARRGAIDKRLALSEDPEAGPSSSDATASPFKECERLRMDSGPCQSGRVAQGTSNS